MIWKITIHSKIGKQLKRFPKKDIKLIESVFFQLKINPFVGDIKKMAGEENVWRRRIGPYRIFYELFVKEQIVFIFLIKRRTTTTYR